MGIFTKDRRTEVIERQVEMIAAPSVPNLEIIQKAAMPSVPNLEVVRKAAMPINRLIGGELEHLVRIEKATGKEFLFGLTLGMIDALNKNGFRLFVKADSIIKFKYHASLWAEPRQDGVIDSYGTIYRAGHRDDYEVGVIQYVGDIPDFSLDRIEVARPLGLRFGSIHSNQALPVDFSRLTDPVIIGWCRSPEIYLREGRVAHFHDTIGVVVAMWDMDKEINI